LINQQNGLAKAKPFEHAQQIVNLTVPQQDATRWPDSAPGGQAAALEKAGFATAAVPVHIWDSRRVGVSFAPAQWQSKEDLPPCPPN
jgi:hypothetical protein